MKLIADVGLLGMPNAGKSTLISRISSAKPKIADYPFTTLIPNLGVVKKRSGDGYVVADIPGLIEGASEGVGLGHDFLRHVERCRFLVHLIDAAEENPFENYEKINLELKKHSEHLANLYQIVALNKIDAIEDEKKSELIEQFKKVSDNVFMISAVTGEGLDKLTDFMGQKVDEIPKSQTEIVVEEDLNAYNNDDSSFEVFKAAKDTFIVQGGKISRLAGVTDERNAEQVIRLQNILKAMGVFDELSQKGIKDGDTIIIGHLEFAFYSDEIYG
ncbi:gTPase obg [Clostridium sp. CAG:967]|nr:gTPase obg [Clostridium sp. CAG:967]